MVVALSQKYPREAAILTEEIISSVLDIVSLRCSQNTSWTFLPGSTQKYRPKVKFTLRRSPLPPLYSYGTCHILLHDNYLSPQPFSTVRLP